MTYYKAFESDKRPFIIWNEWPQNDDDPLIRSEDNVPALVNGICPLKIVDGELVARSEAEMNSAADQTEILVKFAEHNVKIKDVNTGSFVYDTKTFPMDEVSRLFYQSVEKVRGNTKLMTIEGVLYSLIDTATNIDDFMAAYYEKLNELTQPNV